MPTAALSSFKAHLQHSAEAVFIYEYLKNSGYAADFGLRYIWVAGISALDHFITELIIEKSTEQFSNGIELSPKLLNEGVPISGMLKIHGANAAEAVVHFREIIQAAVRFRTFQKANDISDGLSYIWTELHKWNLIADRVGMTNRSAKYKLNSIAFRRDRIVHNADFDEATGLLNACKLDDAKEVLRYLDSIASAIDALVA